MALVHIHYPLGQLQDSSLFAFAIHWANKKMTLKEKGWTSDSSSPTSTCIELDLIPN